MAALNSPMSSANSSRMVLVALVRFMVQISGNQPPDDEQNVATDGCALTLPASAKAYTVPDEPRLMVIEPGAMLPVPMAPIMLSPPPLETIALGLMPRRCAIAGRMVPTA